MFESLRPRTVTLIEAAHSAGAFPLWEMGVHGEGVMVAVLDSGVNDTEVLTGRIASRVDLTGENDTRDALGHGTKMSEFVMGYAPKARIVSVKVVNRDGLVTRDVLIRGLEYCAERYPEIRVVNVSLGLHPRISWRAECTRDKPCNLCMKVNEVVASGLSVIAAVGNYGWRDRVLCPANARSALSLGASGYIVDNWRSRMLERIAPSYYYGVKDTYTGTSISAALASGGVALLVSAIPGLVLAEVKDDLRITSTQGKTPPDMGGPMDVHFYRIYQLACHKRAGKPFDPNRAEHHFFTGLNLRAFGAYRESITEFERAVELFPTAAILHNELGLGYLNENMPEQAMRSFSEAVRLHWDEAIPHDNLGLALERLGRKSEALRHYEIALQRDPNLKQATNHVWRMMQDVQPSMEL